MVMRQSFQLLGMLLEEVRSFNEVHSTISLDEVVTHSQYVVYHYQSCFFFCNSLAQIKEYLVVVIQIVRLGQMNSRFDE